MTSFLQQILTVHLAVFSHASARAPFHVTEPATYYAPVQETVIDHIPAPEPPTVQLSGRCKGVAHNYQRAVAALVSCAALCDCDMRCDYWSYCSAGGARGRGPHQAHCYLYPRHECTSLLYKGAESPWVTGHYSTLSPSCPWLFNKIFLWNGIVL